MKAEIEDPLKELIDRVKETMDAPSPARGRLLAAVAWKVGPALLIREAVGQLDLWAKMGPRRRREAVAGLAKSSGRAPPEASIAADLRDTIALASDLVWNEPDSADARSEALSALRRLTKTHKPEPRFSTVAPTSRHAFAMFVLDEALVYVRRFVGTRKRPAVEHSPTADAKRSVATRILHRVALKGAGFLPATVSPVWGRPWSGLPADTVAERERQAVALVAAFDRVSKGQSKHLAAPWIVAVLRALGLKRPDNFVLGGEYAKMKRKRDTKRSRRQASLRSDKS